MISFLDDAIANGIWGDIDYDVHKKSAIIWEARLKDVDLSCRLG
jgi:hypothetical protein